MSVLPRLRSVSEIVIRLWAEKLTMESERKGAAASLRTRTCRDMAAACVPEHSPTVPSHVSTGFPNLTGSQGAVAWSKYLQEPQNFTRLHELLQLDAPESCAREALESAVWSSVESAQSAPAQIQLTVTESTIAARLHADWGRAPSDRPDAILVADLPDAKCWRRAGVDGATDEYETEVWLPVQNRRKGKPARNGSQARNVVQRRNVQRGGRNGRVGDYTERTCSNV